MTNPCQGHAAESARDEHMKEAERLVEDYGGACCIHFRVAALEPGNEDHRSDKDAARAALLAHIQRGASAVVPGVMHCARCKFRLQRVNLYVNNGTVGAGDNAPESCPNGCGPLWPVTWEQEAREGYKLTEDLFERAKRAEDTLDDMRKQAPAPAGVLMPDVFMYGVKEPDGGAWMQEVCVSTLKGDVDELVDDLNEGRDDADTRYTPVSLVTMEDAKRYGAACRAAGEAVGYARGLRDAVRDADIEALRLYVRALCKAVDAATDFAGTVAGGASWWDDVWADHAAALDRARERISQAALRGEVK